MTGALPLEKLLAEVAGVVADLDAATPRLTLTANYGERTSSGSKTVPLPVNIDAVSCKHQIHRALMKAALRLGEPLTGRTPANLANHLTRHLALIQQQGWAAQLHTQLQPLIQDARNATTVRAERINVGECGYTNDAGTCTTQLIPQRDQDTITCRNCGTIWDVKTRQRDAIGGAWLAVGYPATIIRSLAAYGITIKPKHFENWVRLGHLKPAAEQDGRKQYRVNEVWAVARRMEERRKITKQ